MQTRFMERRFGSPRGQKLDHGLQTRPLPDAYPENEKNDEKYSEADVFGHRNGFRDLRPELPNQNLGFFEKLKIY